MDLKKNVSIGVGLLIFPKLSEKKREKIIKKRLNKLVSHAKNNSPFFKEHYKDLGQEVSLEEIPYTTKPMMYENYDRWHTVPGITWAGTQAFMDDPNNRGRDYHGTTPAATSGSTGHPIIVCLDRTTGAVSMMLSLIRDMKLRFPIASIFLNEGFDICSAQMDRNHRDSKFTKRLACMLNMRMPKEELCRQLNEVKPQCIISYSSILFQLASSDYKLSFRPSCIFCSGEYLSRKAREKMAEHFGAPVRAIYGCTEIGPIATECRCGHLHVHEDWVIIEAVDADNKPVPYGTRSEKVLVTSLSNYTHPVIRYEMTDRVIVHNETCACGKPGKWLEIEGRSSDILTFEGINGAVEVPVIMMFELIECGLLEDALTYQMILHNNNVMEFRVTPVRESLREELYKRTREVLVEYLTSIKVKNPTVVFSQTPPQKATANGKIKRFYQVHDDYCE